MRDSLFPDFAALNPGYKLNPGYERAGLRQVERLMEDHGVDIGFAARD